MTPRNADSINTVVPTNILCNKKTSPDCGKPPSVRHTNYQSDHRGCLANSGIIDGKPLGLKHHNIVTLQTHDAAHMNGRPGLEVGGNDLNFVGKPNSYIHSTVQPLPEDLTPYC